MLYAVKTGGCFKLNTMKTEKEMEALNWATKNYPDFKISVTEYSKLGKMLCAFVDEKQKEIESLNSGLYMQNVIMDRMKDEIELLKNPPTITSAG